MTYGFRVLRTHATLLRSLRPILIMALFGSILETSFVYARVKAGSCRIADHALSINMVRRRWLLREVTPIAISFSPVDLVSGTKPTNDAR